MMLRVILSLGLALIASSSNAAGRAPVIRIERPVLISRPDGDWIRSTTNDCYFVLRFVIDTTGRASSITVADRGFADPKQIQAAIDYAKGYRFKPGTRNGEPFEVAVSQPFFVNIAQGPSVSSQFNDESRKVVGMIKEGDFAGASNHAEWMLSELVRSQAECLGLQGTMAQAFASAGHVHSAIMALRSATVRTKAPPKLVPGAAIPKNNGANYQFNNPQYIANLLDLRLRLAVQQGFLQEALWTYRDLAGLVRMKSDDPRIPLAAQLTDELKSDAPLVGQPATPAAAASSPESA